ncbi:minor tail protein [Microbacterium phage Dismas]|uniref:Minor tail protein n=2 Tax=Dismasvirus dismas TaxID=2560588 RepID=A0A2H5BFN2_9CAUD|nr:minor tail protein [Microbacterium phage Dismas]AUG84813.1 minor tail protein [Microbacterium phage Dismas]AVR57179.1 minor tail protein [Microbacterium phage Kieran]UYL86804.1 minor tail protein [Microbacterium phage Rona]
MIDATVRFVGANGTSVTLLDTADGLMRRPGGSGWGMAPVVNSWFEGAGDGARLRGTRRVQRELVVPVSAFGTDRQGVENLIRQLAGAIRNPFRVFMDYADGRSYWIEAVYEAGASGTYGNNPEHQNDLPLVFKCPDPYWTSVQFQTLEVKPALGLPLLPELAELHVSSSVAQGQVTVENVGDVASRPTWTITGPGSGLSITIGGRGIVLPAYTIAAGTVITVKFEEGGWTIKNQLGQSLYTQLGPAPWFPEFPPGTSVVDVSMADATTATSISAIYPERREVMY